MYNYGIGLDIGVASVGWAVVALDAQEEPCGILGMGSRIFDAAEQPKTGESLAAPRREARSGRRRLRRRRHRKERIKQLIVNSGLLTQEELDGLFEGQLEDVYALRVRALDEAVTKRELARILIHISQRRGFKSNRKGEASKEDGKLLKAVGENMLRMSEKGYRTVGEMMYRDEVFAEYKRNKGENYIGTVTRAMIEDEVRAIFAAQRSHGSAYAGEELEEAYLDILLSQRSFDDGPGGDSKYKVDFSQRMGTCALIPENRRAPKACYSFEYFNLLQNINHIRLQSSSESAELSAEQREAITALAHKKESLNYAAIRKELKLDDSVRFNMVSYQKDKTAEDCEKAKKFEYLRNYHTIRKALDKVHKGRITELSRQQLNVIGEQFTFYKTWDKIKSGLEQNGIEAQDIEALEEISGFSKAGHLSTEACDRIIPFLEQGMKYNEACEAAGLSFKGHDKSERETYLHLRPEDTEDITSPVVLRAVSQTVKVINAIIRKRGCSPTYINIELAREMSKNFSDRKKIEKEQTENRSRNERILEDLKATYGMQSPGGQDIIKLRLYQEQQGFCAYSGKTLDAQRVFTDPGYTEVDHIIPYSISFDDSFNNKVLVLTAENREKSNRLPLQYLTGEKREQFIVRTNSFVRNPRKRRNLLLEKLPEDKEFRERNLQDTKYMAVFLYNYLTDRLEFAPSEKRKRRVNAVNGSVTAYLRKRWGINKVREDGDLHHAVDALVIACTTNGMIQRVTDYSKARECRYAPGENEDFKIDPKTGELVRRFPYPWDCFRKELEARLANDPVRIITELKLPFYLDSDIMSEVKPLFVSRMPKRKVTGAAHKDTIKSAKALDSEGVVLVKRPLTALKLDKDGEIQDYFHPESDPMLYNALKERLKAFGGNAEKAFSEPFYKPSRDGKTAPRVKKVLLTEKPTLCVPVHKGQAVADNDRRVRVDVFHVEGDGYYLVPIYVADTLKPELPNKACVKKKRYSDWKIMKDEDFVFSLYPNDLFKATSKTNLPLKLTYTKSTRPEAYETKSEFMYYTSTDIKNAAIDAIVHDGAYSVHGMGVKSLLKLEKYTVDVLGEYHPVKRETRQKFNIGRK